MKVVLGRVLWSITYILREHWAPFMVHDVNNPLNLYLNLIYSIQDFRFTTRFLYLSNTQKETPKVGERWEVGSRSLERHLGPKHGIPTTMMKPFAAPMHLVVFVEMHQLWEN